MSKRSAGQSFIPIRHRAFAGDHDFWRIRQFLCDTYSLTPLGLNWDVRRWDGFTFYNPVPGIPDPISKAIWMWEGQGEELLGVVYVGNSGEIHLFVHPGFRELEPQMFELAESLLQDNDSQALRPLTTFVYDYDLNRSDLVQNRGYQATETIGIIRRLYLEHAPALRAALPEGYEISNTAKGDPDSGRAIAVLLNAAFHRDFHVPEEFVSFSRLAPSFVEGLDLVAHTEQGEVVAYVGIAYDERNRLGIFEPVCTHPGHQKRGLARNLMIEGMHRLRAIGGREVIVSTGGMEAANRLYDSIGFIEREVGRNWTKS